ncbi:MAG: pyruvate formate lyase family protein [Planctomycetota bacterium]|jgi:formate C-acetyltransferase
MDGAGLPGHVTPEILRELGEWAALGFYEGQDLPWPRSYGLACRRLYENMEVTVPDGRLLVPHEPFPHARTMESHGVWSPEGFICDFHHNSGLRVNVGIAEEKKKRFGRHAEAIDALVNDLGPRLRHFGGYTHCNPDMRRVVDSGFLAMEAELDEEIECVRRADGGGEAEANKELNLLLALKDYATGVRDYHDRVARALAAAVEKAAGERKRKLALVADGFASCFLTPAQTFLEGLLAVNLAWMLDGCDSIGRLDQVLGGLFERDVESGALDIGFARELLDELWRAFERLNGWNLQLGGLTPDGGDGVNALTMECIAACGRNRFRRPNVALRVTKRTPDEALASALEVLSDGGGRPALYNDELYVQTLASMDLGLSEEDAREVGFGGCTETMIAGLSNVGSLEGELNLAKALELALNDGYDPVGKRQLGPHTGAFETFECFDAFAGAVKRQIRYMTDAFVARQNELLARRFREGDPKLYRTFFTRDCVKRHRSFEAGGARYNWAVVSYQGIANLIDSLAAVRRCIYAEGQAPTDDRPALTGVEEKTVGRKELLVALTADFEGYEPLRRKLEGAPRFGNDEAYVDEIGRDVLRFAWEELYSHETPRGGRYLPSCILFATYGAAGRQVGALPDGRKAFEVLTDSVGPAQGRDTAGPTAMLNSVARLPLSLAVGTPVLNARFQKAIFETADGLEAVASLVRAFFDRGGMQIQISVVSKEEMLAAQREPEKHGDLIVRIGGYSEYFARLGRELQDSVIARTEHAV